MNIYCEDHGELESTMSLAGFGASDSKARQARDGEKGGSFATEQSSTSTARRRMMGKTPGVRVGSTL